MSVGTHSQAGGRSHGRSIATRDAVAVTGTTLAHERFRRVRTIVNSQAKEVRGFVREGVTPR